MDNLSLFILGVCLSKLEEFYIAKMLSLKGRSKHFVKENLFFCKTEIFGDDVIYCFDSYIGH